VAFCLLLPGAWKYALGGLLFLLSAWRSYSILSRESDFVQKLIKRFRP
jgi:hypothetical protein